MAIDNIAPAGFVERLAMRGVQIARLVDVGVGDRLGQVFLEDGLQAEEDSAVVQAAARLDVEERGVGIRRVLQPVLAL